MSMELALLGELLMLGRNPDVSLDEFGEKAATSPHLAAEIVRVSNSALYGMEGRINRLERAVLILGIRTVSTIASSVLVAQELRAAPIPGLSPDALWVHSLETGVCAQLIARCLSLPMESEAYLGGLLHDLGIPELYKQHGARYSDLIAQAQKRGECLEELERAAFDTTHGEVLARQTLEWGFPELLQSVVAHHHAPERADDASRPVAMLIHAAHIMMRQHGADWIDGTPSESDPRVLADLGLTPEDVDEVLSLLGEQIKEVASAIG